MELRSGYKQSELGDIPTDWDVSLVGKEFSVQLGKMLDAEKNIGVPKPYLGNRAVQWGRVDVTEIGSIKMSPTELKRFRLQKNDLLVCEGGDVGRAAIWDEPVPECYYQKALHRLRPTRGYNIRLMVNVLHHLASRGFLLNFVTQTSIAHLPKDKFETVPIPLPPTTAEQDAIAEALSDADALIGALERLIAKKRLIKQGAMQELLTGRKRLPGFSDRWHIRQLGTVVDTDPEQLASDTSPTYVFNYIALEDVDQGSLVSSTERVFRDAPSRARRKLRRGDVLVSTVRPNLKSHLLFSINGEDWVCSTGFCVVRCRKGVTHPGFLYFHMMAGLVNQQIETLLTGSNYPAINSGDVQALEIPFPDFKEQHAIAEVLADMETELVALTAQLVSRAGEKDTSRAAEKGATGRWVLSCFSLWAFGFRFCGWLYALCSR